jgi:hypothetical protein
METCYLLINRQEDLSRELELKLITKAIFMSNMEPEQFNKTLEDYNKMSTILSSLKHPENKIEMEKFAKRNEKIINTFKGKNLKEFLGGKAKIKTNKKIKEDFTKDIKNWSKI